MMAPQPPSDREPVPFATWEWASWTLTFLLALVILAACIQRWNEQDEWSHVAPAHTTTGVVCQPRGGCYRK